MAERSIRTFEDMLYKRLGDGKTKQWSEFVYPILLTYSYMLVHSSTQFTPTEARTPSNQMNGKINMAIKATHGRRYTDINVGDHVKIFKNNQLVANFKPPIGVNLNMPYYQLKKHGLYFIKWQGSDLYYVMEF